MGLELMSVGLVIKRSLSLGSIPEQTMRRCVFGEDPLRIVPVEAKQTTHSGSTITLKNRKQNPQKGNKYKSS